MVSGYNYSSKAASVQGTIQPNKWASELNTRNKQGLFSKALLLVTTPVGKQLVRVPNLYFGSRLGAQYPKNSKIFLWRLPQPSFGDALV